MSERIAWIVIVCILGISLFMVRNDLQSVEQWVDEQNEQLDEINSLLDMAEARLAEVRSSGNGDETSDYTDFAFDPLAIPDYEIRQLRNNGLSEPLEDLKNDLKGRTDLISVDPVLGGTMRIHSTDEIAILPGGYAYAIFEDGHINGAMVLSYSVQNAEISWSVLDIRQF